ncbi:hypothetical protein ACHAXM_010419 [Skeletonema potamos]|jgi:uncharacterized protein YbjT (DUF2867 family)
MQHITDFTWVSLLFLYQMNPIRLLLTAASLAAAAAFAPNKVILRPVHPKSSALYVQGQGDGYKKVFVAGGSKGVGRLVVDKLLSEGAEVVALVRSDEKVEELSALDGVTAIKGDAADYKTVEGAMDGCDAAITTLGGGSQAEDGKFIDYTGNNNVIEAAGILGVTRVVLVTSIGCGSSKNATPPSVYEVLKDVLAQKEKAENVLIKYYTNMNWTIVRPGGLVSGDATGKAILTEDTMAIGSINRADVANLVVQALSSKSTEKKILSAVDPTISSSANTEGRVSEAFALA